MSRGPRKPPGPPEAKATSDSDGTDAWNPFQPISGSDGDADVAPITDAECARRIRIYLAARRRRDMLLGPGWFEDPAWDMLLDLLASRHENKVITVTSACIAGAVPSTTALRWLKALVRNGAVVREEDPTDGRRVFVEIAPELADRLQQWVASSLPPSEA